MFTITKVHIQPGCLYKKCLHEGEYMLEHKLTKDFFAPNVCVTAKLFGEPRHCHIK